MSKPHFTKAEAIPLIQAAYKEGRLSAQRKDIKPGDVKCEYRDDAGCPCAIGVLVDDGTATDWDRNGASLNFTQVLDRGKATTDNDEWFIQLQTIHDDWLQHGGHHIMAGRKTSNEQRFREYIGL